MGIAGTARLLINNDGHSPLELTVEPWADTHRIPPGGTRVVVIHSPDRDGPWHATLGEDQPFRVEHRPDAITVWANSTCYHLSDTAGAPIDAEESSCPARRPAAAGPIAPLPPVRSDLTVIYTEQLDACRAFYTGLGLPLLPERHGTGPEHYAAELDGTVFELYPAGRRGVTGYLRLGLVAAAPGLRPGQHTLTDPDGRTVVLTVPGDTAPAREGGTDRGR
ncbi:hypothetical protein [Streptomyces tsukubensis]|uniref:hypothetical protein n=1 Tax=Streptomyces tsukubensis TaxID=83656 RepID=UPI0034509166